MSVLRNVSGNLLSFQEHEASLVGALHDIPCCDQLLLSSSIVFFQKERSTIHENANLSVCARVSISVAHVYVCVCVCVCVSVGGGCVCVSYLYLSMPCSRCVHVSVCASEWHMSVNVCVSYVYIYICGSTPVCMCVSFCPSFSRSVCVNIRDLTINFAN